MYQDWMKEVPVLGDIEINIDNDRYYLEKYWKVREDKE